MPIFIAGIILAFVMRTTPTALPEAILLSLIRSKPVTAIAKSSLQVVCFANVINHTWFAGTTGSKDYLLISKTCGRYSEFAITYLAIALSLDLKSLITKGLFNISKQLKKL